MYYRPLDLSCALDSPDICSYLWQLRAETIGMGAFSEPASHEVSSGHKWTATELCPDFVSEPVSGTLE